MTVAVNSSVARPRQRGFKKMVVILLFITCIGWLILFTWAMCLWTCDGFESACIAVNRVSIAQRQTISIFEDESLLTRLSASITPIVTDNTRVISRQMTQAQQSIRNEVLEQWQQHVVADSSNSEAGFSKAMLDLRFHAEECWYLFCATGRVLAVKLSILLASFPLFLWASVAGLVDGLNQRSIRTACLGRESTYVFHKSIPFVKGCIAIVLSIWLSMPMALEPSIIFIGLAIMVSVVMSVSASRFKKYI